MKNVDSATNLLTTGEVAAYLRMKERTVYDMVARQQIPCSRATGKLLFSRSMIDAWVEAHTEMPAGRNAVVPLIYAGSSDPLLEWALRQSGCGLAVLAGGSRRGLEAVARGEAMLAGAHLLDPGTGEYNLSQVRALIPQGDVVVIHWARRVQGLLVATGNPLKVKGLRDVTERGLRLARRAEGTGSQLLLEVLLDREGLSMDGIHISDQVAETERDLASMIAMDEADCALGVAAAADGLGFLPLWPAESFDLVLRRRDYFEPAMQALLSFTRTATFGRRAEHLGGYDLGDLGRVRLNA